MGLRFLRKVLLPFAALVLAACIGTLAIGRTHAAAPAGSSSTAALSASPAMTLTASSSQSAKAALQAGYQLFQQHCSFCHGAQANGRTGLAPNLQGVGPGTVQLWLSNGWMPLRTPSSQPELKKPSFTPPKIRDIAEWVASLRAGGTPFPPVLNLKGSNLSTGFQLFSLNCAPCHTITGAGDAITLGYHAPTLHGVPKALIWDAVRSGPQNMPQFSSATISPAELNDIIKYVTQKIQRPSNPGGLSLGGVGPVAEGFVGLFAGVGACLAGAYWVGDRTERDDDEEHGGHGHDGEDGDALDAVGEADASPDGATDDETDDEPSSEDADD